MTRQVTLYCFLHILPGDYWLRYILGVRLKSPFIVFIGALWLVLSIVGMSALASYSSRPGDPGDSPLSWPQATSLTRFKGFNLLVFVHPECPCSRATIGELDRLLASVKEKPATRVVFLRPAGWSDEQVEGDLWRKAAAIPGVQLSRDSEGRETELFGASTSGHTVLYDVNGRLVFSGGLTASRGHMGDSEGQRTIASHLSGEKTGGLFGRIFGCGLFGSGTRVAGAKP